MSEKLKQFTTPLQDPKIPGDKVKCNDCGALVNATFIEMSTHFEREKSMDQMFDGVDVVGFAKKK